MLILAAVLAGVRRLGRGYLLLGGAACYTLITLAVLTLLRDREMLFSVRLGLTAMLFAGTMLGLGASFVAGRSRSTARRYRMNNYFD